MILFVSTDIVLIALGVVLYLMVRALPRVEEAASDRKGLLDRLAHSELPEKLDNAFQAFLVKFLRKLKVFTMKVDNALSSHLRKINTAEEAAAKAAVSFNEFLNGANIEEPELSEVRN